MSLAVQIQAHLDRANADLDEVHNFYDHTKGVWRICHLSVTEGRKFEFTNTATNTRVDQDQVLGLAHHYATQFLASFTFQRFVAIFETFAFEVLRSFLIQYPQRLSQKEIKFRTVLSSSDIPSLLAKVVDHEINQLKYEKPSEWFDYFENTLRLARPTREEMDKIAEIKACRDILEHNRGIVNSTYVQKAGKEARYKAGDKLEIPEPYHRSSWELIKNAVNEMAAAGIAKFQ
jgi:hypothetical protein